MVYRKRKVWKISLHQRYYSNPLNPIEPLWKLQLLVTSFKTHRNSSRAKYKSIYDKSNHIRFRKNNPCTWFLESKNEEKIYGKY